MKQLYGYQSSYPEDIQSYTKVEKYADEFEKYSPFRNPVGDDEFEDDPEDTTGFNEEIPKREIAYNKKVEYMQMNPIELSDSKVGREQIFKEFASDKPE